MTKTEIDNEPGKSPLLTRLAMVYEYPLRMRIVTELYMREMSPKQFFGEFGGGSVSRVSRHFERLAEYGWLKLERTATGGKRRGAVEHFYRAPELVVFDQETWAELPIPMKAAFSWTSFEQLTERVRTAIAEGTFNSRPDRRHLTWTPILLDEIGWGRVIAAVNAVFETIVEEQERAKLRIAESAETPSLATIGLTAFESPPQAEDQESLRHRSDLALSGGDPKEGIDTTQFFPMQLAKVLADPEALQILAQLNLREMSPKQFHDEFGGGSMSSVGRRFQKLAKTGWLRMVREESGGKRRGATEHFYRAIGPAILDRDDWSELPDQLKATLTWKTFEQFRERAKEAVGAGTFEARADRHFTWSLLLLDQRGWEVVIAAVDALFQAIFLEKLSAESRLQKSGEQPIHATVGLAAFESPKDLTKAP